MRGVRPRALCYTSAARCAANTLPPLKAPMPNGDNLIWIDLEMTGLNTDTDAIIEIATVVTDKELNIVAEGPELAIHQSDEVLARMDAWNQRQHGSSGLLARVRASQVTHRRGAAAHARVPRAAGQRQRLAHVRQQHLPGPALPGAPDARPRALLPLSQPGREHAQGAGAPLGAGGLRGLRQAGRAPGQCRHPRVDPRAASLPRAAVRAGSSPAPPRVASARACCRRAAARETARSRPPYPD